MRRTTVRVVAGLAAVLLVTTVLAGAVATSAALTNELADGDRCETGGSDTGATLTADDLTALAENVTKCIAGGDDSDGAAEPPST